MHKILTENPGMTGVLVDRPEILHYAKEEWHQEGGAFHDGTQDRLEIVEGNFFEPHGIPSAKDGDVYNMRYILHDWGREDCLKILKNLKHAMQGKKAALMIGESAMPDRHTVGIPPAVHKLDILMMNLFGHAVERTPKMFAELLDEAGFEIVDIYPTRSIVHFIHATLRN